MPFEHTHNIKPGYGYWDTTNFPIGGKFARASKDSPLAVEIIGVPQFIKGYGYMAQFRTSDNLKLWASEQSFSPIS